MIRKILISFCSHILFMNWIVYLCFLEFTEILGGFTLFLSLYIIYFITSQW